MPVSLAGAAHPRLDLEGGLTYTALKPDGRTAVFHLARGASSAIEVIDSTLPPFAAQSHDVSADGRTLVYVELSAPHGLFRVNRDGSQRVRLVEEDVAIPRITPDGQVVLFTRTNAAGLYSVAAKGGAVRQLTNRLIPDGRIDRRFGAGFSISPDGQHVLMQTGRPGVLALCRLPLCDAMIERALPSMAWGPDGDGVIELQDGFSILEHPLGGGLPRLIGRLGGRDRVMNLHWSPDGSRLAMSRGYYPNDLMIIKGLR